jgi:hypothetical protein
MSNVGPFAAQACLSAFSHLAGGKRVARGHLSWKHFAVSFESDISLPAMSGRNEKPRAIVRSRRKSRDDWHTVSVCHAGS